MKALELREAVADHVLRLGHVRTEDLVAHFNISRMTVHRHVDALAKQGVLRKLHGAVTAQPSGLYESALSYRMTIAQPEKRALARAAIEYVEAGQAILIDESSTLTAFAALLGAVTPISVATNSVGAAERLARIEDVDLISLGGNYSRVYNAYIGLICEQAIARLRVNALFLSASAIQGAAAFIQDQQIVRVKQAMMAVAQKRILLIDHFKFERTALHMLANLTDFDIVLATDGLEVDRRDALLRSGVNLRIVPVTKADAK
jgi:DeoR/GlpR family transcriptional regulator of sugar metabolism